MISDKLSIDLKKLSEYTKVINKYPDRIPVILVKGSKEAPDATRNKFLVPKDITFGQFLIVLRKHISLKDTDALFVMANNIMLKQSDMMNIIYSKHKGDEGILVLTYTLESTFG